MDTNNEVKSFEDRNPHIMSWLEKAKAFTEGELKAAEEWWKKKWANFKIYFEAHTDVDVFHFAQDGQAFQNEDQAVQHATKTNNGPVDVIHRSDLDGMPEFNAESDNGAEVKIDNGAAKDATSDTTTSTTEVTDVAQDTSDGPGTNENTNDSTPVKHEVTQADLDANPDLVAADVKVGDLIELGESFVVPTGEEAQVADEKKGKKK